MKCEQCGNEARIKQSRRVVDKNGTKYMLRRYHCTLCPHRWSMYEVSQEMFRKFLKKKSFVEGLEKRLDRVKSAATLFLAFIVLYSFYLGV